MAYVFQRIDDALNQNESNIFGDQSSENDPNAGQNIGGGVKTSTEGDVGSTPVSSSSSSTSSSQYNPDYSSDSDILARNVGKTDVGRSGVQNLSTQIQQNKDRLQADADKYMEGVRTQETYDTSPESLDKAIEGDKSAMESTSKVLNQGEFYRPEFEGSDYSVKDVDLLGSNAGMQRLMSQGQGPRYTQGMGAFDAALMQRDPEFQNLVNQVRTDNRAFERDIAARPDDIEAQAQEYGTQARNTARDTAEEYLNNYQTGMVQQNRDEAEAFKNTISNLDREKIYGDVRDEVLADILPDLQQVTGYDDLANFYDPDNIDASSYVNFIDPESIDYRQFVDEQEASRFNNIANLLGGGELYSAGNAPRPQDLYQADTGRLQDLIEADIMGAKNADIDRRTGDIQSDIDLARERNYGSDLVRHYYDNVLAEREAGTEPRRGLMDDGRAGLSDDESQRLADYRMLKERYGDNFDDIYSGDANASRLLQMLGG